MKKFFTKRNIYILLFAILYATVALVSLIHSFSFFGLANNSAMSIMLGTAFEIGQAAVLFALLTSSRDRSRFMPWALMVLLTLVQIIGNVFSSYKYLMQHNVADLQYFKERIFVWTNLPDNVTTVLVTYIVGAILPIVALCMTSMIANYLEDNKKENKKETITEEVDETNAQIEGDKEKVIHEDESDEYEETDKEIDETNINNNDVIEMENISNPVEDKTEEIENSNPQKQSHFINI